MASLLPENTPARRIFDTLTQRAPRLSPAHPLELDPDTRSSIAEAAARSELSEAELIRLWLAEKAEEYRQEVRLEATWETLTPREQVIVGRYCAGYEEPELAEAEGIQPATVRHHMHRAMKKFQVEKRGQLRHLLRNWDFSAFDQ